MGAIYRRCRKRSSPLVRRHDSALWIRPVNIMSPFALSLSKGAKSKVRSRAYSSVFFVGGIKAVIISMGSGSTTNVLFSLDIPARVDK